MMPLCSRRFVSPNSADITMPLSLDSGKAIAIAVSLLKHENPKTIQALKDLLTFIPNPNQVKDILTTAVQRLIYISPQSALWLFQHPELLEPEIRVSEIVAQELIGKLISWGYQLDNIYFTPDYQLKVNESTKQSLLSHQVEASDEPILTLIRSLLIL